MSNNNFISLGFAIKRLRYKDDLVSSKESNWM